MLFYEVWVDPKNENDKPEKIGEIEAASFEEACALLFSMRSIEDQMAFDSEELLFEGRELFGSGKGFV